MLTCFFVCLYFLFFFFPPQNINAPKAVWVKVGSVVDDRHVVQVQMVRTTSALRALWSAPSINITNRTEGEPVVLDVYTMGSVFISLPMLSKGQQKMFEEKMAAMPEAASNGSGASGASGGSGATKRVTPEALAAAAVKAAVAAEEAEQATVTSENKSSNRNEDSMNKPAVEKNIKKSSGPLIQDVTEVDELD